MVVLCLDFSKTFVSHRILLEKPHGLHRCSFLLGKKKTGWMAVPESGGECATASWWPVTAAVSQGSFNTGTSVNTFINDLGEGSSAPSVSSQTALIWVGVLGSRALQGDLNRLDQ